MAAATRKTPPRQPTSTRPTAPQVTPSKDSFLELLLYALPRFSDLLRRITDIKNSAASRRLRMSPAVALWLSLALVGLVISANSYFVGFQTWQPDANTITTVIPLGRGDVAFRPMALFPPLLLWLSKVVNFSMWLVGLVIPDMPFTNGASPQWNPTAAPDRMEFRHVSAGMVGRCLWLHPNFINAGTLHPLGSTGQTARVRCPLEQDFKN